MALGAPSNGTIEIAGPEAFPLHALIRKSLAARNDPRGVIVDEQARYFGAPLTERTLVPDAGAWLGATRFEDWLAASLAG